jgi:ketosteroid isomerase-like protein
MITDDAVFVGTTGPPVVGREEIGEHYSTYFQKFDIREIAAHSPPEILLMGDNAVVWSVDQIELTPLDDTPPITLARRTMTLFREENGSWKISRGLSCVVADDPG